MTENFAFDAASGIFTAQYESTIIQQTRYRESTQELWVDFHKGGTYSYYPVALEIHQQLLIADSVGRAFRELIRGDESIAWQRGEVNLHALAQGGDNSEEK
jgi:KTSC domain